MIKNFSPIKNEKGFSSLVLVLGVTSVASLMILQLSVAFQSNRLQHRKTAVRSKVGRHMQELAQKIKRNFDMTQLDPTCRSLGAGYVPLNLPGHTSSSPKRLCINRSNGLCITDESLFGDDTPVCVSTTAASFNWRDPGGAQSNAMTFGSIRPTNVDRSTFGARTRTNVIQVPSRSNPVWKSCSGGSNCIRLEMCPPGQTSCSGPGEKVTQVIRIGL